MTRKEILAMVEQASAEAEYGDNADSLYDFLKDDCTEVYSESLGDSRWWKNLLTVVRVGDALVGFEDAETSGDDSPQDVGWEFNKDSICGVEEYQVTLTKFRRVRDGES